MYRLEQERFTLYRFLPKAKLVNVEVHSVPSEQKVMARKKHGCPKHRP